MKTINYFLYIIFFTITLYLLYSCFGHTSRINFNSVKLPSSIAIMLEKEYGHGGNTGASNHVHNLADRNNYQFENSIYTYKGQGPHYPRKLFIYQDSVFFFFSEYIDGASDKRLFLLEYDSCAKLLKLDKERINLYDSIILDYIHEEEGITYGNEIKN